jgi:hypothetical protein
MRLGRRVLINIALFEVLYIGNARRYGNGTGGM